MKLYPAVDIREGRCVRLLRGEFDRETVFSEDPVAVARGWWERGAALVHVVDLDGARTGFPANAALIEAMVSEGLPLQVGGGIRDRDRAAELLRMGVKRVVVGTLAAREMDALGRLVDDFPGRIVAAVDCRDGRVAVEGWQRQLRIPAVQLCRELKGTGVERVLVTDIARDGTRGGPNVQLIEEILSVGPGVIASGGVGSIEDLEGLWNLAAELPGLEGVVVGRALYDGTIPTADVLAFLKDDEGGEVNADQASDSLP
ncbi:MAG: 1-(5-phosphoribosyl)-5-[(5-phosphoribosylamino)methylideneamino]imidazole-4-carboxamide isomerase [Bacillota bacterium]